VKSKLTALCFALTMLLLSGCANQASNEIENKEASNMRGEQKMSLPQLFVSFSAADTQAQRFQAILAHIDWTDCTGNPPLCRTMLADSVPPLMLWESAFDNATFALNDASGTFTLFFDHYNPPDYVSVTRWNIRYSSIYVDIHDEVAENITTKAENVDISGLAFAFSNDGEGYIYSIFAEWFQYGPYSSHGRITYTFRVNSE